MHIQPYDPQQLEPVIRFALNAWAPVFDSLRAALSPDLYGEFYPDWRANQRAAIEEVLASPEMHTWVAVEDAAPVGFVAVKYTPGGSMGEVYMVAVDPAYQRRGVGAALTQYALDWLKDAGAAVAMVETGGDPGSRAGAPHL